jgi:hypothetical protein
MQALVNADGTPCETPEGRTINPGHSIETSWFTMEEAKFQKDDELLKKALTVLVWSLDWGWDEVQGVEETWSLGATKMLTRFDVMSDANGVVTGTFAAADANGGAFNGLTLVGDIRKFSGLSIVLK